MAEGGDLLPMLLEMGFPKVRCEKAILATGGKNLDTVTQWLDEHKDDPDIDDPEALPEAAATSGTADGAQAQSIKCDECGKLFSNADFASVHAERTGHTAFSESTESKKPLSPEEMAEQKKLLEKKIAESRRQREVIDAKNEREREVKRREAGKLAAKTREELAEAKAKQEADKRRKEKAADKAYLAKLKADMAREKAARAQRNKEFAVGAQAAAAPAAATPAPAAAPAAAPTSCLIQVRQTNGSAIKNKFEPTDTVQTLVDWITSNRTDGSGPFVVVTAYPRKQLGPNDMSKTLQDAGLAPRGQVTLQNA